MGGQSRYKVGMFDHNWRVLLVDQTGVAKPELIHGCDGIDEALTAYKAALEQYPGRYIEVRQGTRVVRRSDRDKG